jgi:hypothetical protein
MILVDNFLYTLNSSIRLTTKNEEEKPPFFLVLNCLRFLKGTRVERFRIDQNGHVGQFFQRQIISDVILVR